MKVPPVSTLKKELSTLTPAEMLEICMKLVKFKKENKEYLSYLLFNAGNDAEYVRNVKDEIDQLFSEINLGHIYFAKKSLRKILRVINKYIRYSSRKQTEVELLIHFCSKMNALNIPFRKINSLNNLYDNQVRKIRLAIAALHEDLQHDYQNELTTLLI
jgi:hypothetical protein